MAHEVCWGHTHRFYAAVTLGLLIFLLPTATVIGTHFMESESDTKTVYGCFTSKATSVRWTQSYQLWQIGVDMAIGTATVIFPESSVIRLAIVVFWLRVARLLHSCRVSLPAFVVYQPLDKRILHWHPGAINLYLLNGQGWLQEGTSFDIPGCLYGLVNIDICV